MDVAPFTDFSYSDKEAWADFAAVNALAHVNYNAVIELAGFQVTDYPVADIGDTKEAEYDWLQAHYLMHRALTATLGLPNLPDLTDVNLHDENEFNTWLQLHIQQHQLIDLALNL